MRETSTSLDRLKRLAARVRPHHLVAAGAIAVVGLVFMTVRAVALPGPRPVLEGDRLHIEVVTPAAPEIRPGSVMDVGELVDGFEYRPPPRRAPDPFAYAPDDEAFEPEPSRPPRQRYGGEPVVVPPPQPEAPKDGWRDSRAGRWFGFDAPDRDYRAEREARRAQREAREAREAYPREERSVRWYRSDGEPVEDPRERRRPRDEGPPPDRW